MTFCRVLAETYVHLAAYLEVLNRRFRAEIVDFELTDFATLQVRLVTKQHLIHVEACEGLQLSQPMFDVLETT